MHLKNFSILKPIQNRIEMSPAYDLLASQIAMPEDKELLALSLNGKKNKVTRDDFNIFAANCKISPRAVENIFSDFQDQLPIMPSWLKKSFLNQEVQSKYLALISERADLLKIKVPHNFKGL